MSASGAVSTEGHGPPDVSLAAKLESAMSEAKQLDDGVRSTSTDPLRLVRALEASDRFHRDSTLGGIFHRGKISFREVSSTDSLHVTIDGNRVSAHVDRVSPVRSRSDGTSGYSPGRVFLHNFLGIGEDVTRWMRGRWGEHRCQLDCEAVWVDEQPGVAVEPGVELECDPQEPAFVPASSVKDETLGVPFSQVDEAVLLLDTDAAPWSVQLEARVSGSLDEARLREALVEALAQHPMARARRMPASASVLSDRWEIPDALDLDPLRAIDCPDDEALAVARAELQSKRVPLAESPPLRVRLARHPGGDVVMFNVNHAATDGFGALRVLESVARAYAGEPDPEPQVGFLESRELPMRLTLVDAPTKVRRWLVLLGRLGDLVAPPARLAPDGASANTGYGLHHLSLSRRQTSALERGRRNGTVNDVLLATLHRAIAGWNAEHGVRTGRIGVLVPANLRPEAWRHDVAGNFSLPSRVSTTRASRASRCTALDKVTAQTSRKKASGGMGTALIEILGRSPRSPLWAKQALTALLPLTGDRLVDTAMLSNIGRLEEPPWFGPEAGDTVEMWFSPPARMPLGLAIGAVTVGGQLHLVFRYRHRLFSRHAAERFAARYLTDLAGFLVQ